MSRAVRALTVASAILLLTAATGPFRSAETSAQTAPPGPKGASPPAGSFDAAINQNGQRMLEEGRRIFPK